MPLPTTMSSVSTASDRIATAPKRGRRGSSRRELRVYGLNVPEPADRLLLIRTASSHQLFFRLLHPIKLSSRFRTRRSSPFLYVAEAVLCSDVNTERSHRCDCVSMHQP